MCNFSFFQNLVNGKLNISKKGNKSQKNHMAVTEPERVSVDYEDIDEEEVLRSYNVCFGEEMQYYILYCYMNCVSVCIWFTEICQYFCTKLL